MIEFFGQRTLVFLGVERFHCDSELLGKKRGPRNAHAMKINFSLDHDCGSQTNRGTGVHERKCKEGNASVKDTFFRRTTFLLLRIPISRSTSAGKCRAMLEWSHRSKARTCARQSCCCSSVSLACFAVSW